MTGGHGPFTTIESAQEFVRLLDEAIDEALQEAGRELSACSARSQQRRVEAWQVVLYKMTGLASHVGHTRRLLNDLRTLRNLLQRTDSGHEEHEGALPHRTQRSQSVLITKS